MKKQINIYKFKELKEYMPYKTYLRKRQSINSLKNEGFVFIKGNNFKRVLGLGCLVVAIIPNGLFIPFSILGCYILGIQKHEVKNLHIPELKRKSKYYLREVL